MNFYKKPSNNKVKNFWVEDYSPTERKFFLSLGFTEKTCTENEKLFGIKETLNFKGTGEYNFWSEEEAKRIYTAVMKRFNLKRIVVEIQN
jgi:hypothetical protein